MEPNLASQLAAAWQNILCNNVKPKAVYAVDCLRPAKDCSNILARVRGELCLHASCTSDQGSQMIHRCLRAVISFEEATSK